MTPDEAAWVPLTDADRRTAVQLELGSCWRGEWLLAGGDRAHQVRASDGGCAGWPTDHCSVAVYRSRQGLLVRVSEHPEGRWAEVRHSPAAVRVGRISWRQAEDILRATQPHDGALFDLEVS